jgi:serine phosphatase RsbU (regulator of sigma subunit)
MSVVGDKIVSLGALKISSALEFVVLSISMSNKYGELQREKEEAQKIALKNLEEKNAVMDEANTRLEEQVKQRTAKINQQNKALAKSRNEIISSIRYAERIQLAILPPKQQIEDISEHLFVYYNPKDVVSGDFYFVEKTTTSEQPPVDYTVIAAVDCTGHGVPGALMSIVGNNILQQTISHSKVNTPAEALDFLHQGVVNNLQRNVEGGIVRDGMDIAMCALKNDCSELMFAGARNPLYVIRKKSALAENDIPANAILREETDDLILFEIKGDRSSIGSLSKEVEENGHTNHKVKLSKGDKFFLFSDGYADQFGGERGKKFRYSRFRQLLLDSYSLDVKDQTALLKKAFNSWRGKAEQIDDVLVMGMRIPD